MDNQNGGGNDQTVKVSNKIDNTADQKSTPVDQGQRCDDKTRVKQPAKQNLSTSRLSSQASALPPTQAEKTVSEKTVVRADLKSNLSASSINPSARADANATQVVPKAKPKNTSPSRLKTAKKGVANSTTTSVTNTTTRTSTKTGVRSPDELAKAALEDKKRFGEGGKQKSFYETSRHDSADSTLVVPSDRLTGVHNEIALGGVLNGRFVLEEVLGAGGMGEVFKAKDLRRVEMHDSSPYVALKLLRSEFRSDTRFMVALQRESKKVQKLSHPNIVTVHDFDRDGDAAYINMEFLQGEPLDRAIFGKGMETKRALRIIDRMARGLAYAHQEGYVHADFKPGNVFLADAEDGDENAQLVKILDFGIAQAVIRDKSGYRNVASDDDDPEMFALTPNYATFEMLKGQQPLPVDDVYSFCCVAYELLTGKHPYADQRGKKRTALEAQELGLVPPAIEGIPKSYQRALKKGVSIYRKDRFDNAGDFLDAIKPKVSKKQVAVAALFSILSVFMYFSVDTWNEQKVPTLGSLEEVFSSSAEMIKEGDDMLKEDDIDLAHRFYAQAWNAGNDLKGVDDSLETLKRIVDDRMNKIADHLIDEATKDDVDEFRLQQLQIALEFVKEDSLGTQDKKIESVLERLRKKD